MKLSRVSWHSGEKEAQSWKSVCSQSSRNSSRSLPRRFRRGPSEALKLNSSHSTVPGTVGSNQVDGDMASVTASVANDCQTKASSTHSPDGTSFHTMSVDDNDLCLEDNDFEQGIMEKIRSKRSKIPVLPLVTINQNDFMMQCMINTSTPCFVHFYIDGSVASEALDEELGQLHSLHMRCIKAVKKAAGVHFQESAESTRACRFLRMNAAGAPFITAKLQVSNQDPSVICFHNGKVFQRIADPDSYVPHPGQVQRWAMDTGLLDM